MWRHSSGPMQSQLLEDPTLPLEEPEPMANWKCQIPVGDTFRHLPAIR